MENLGFISIKKINKKKKKWITLFWNQCATFRILSEQNSKNYFQIKYHVWINYFSLKGSYVKDLNNPTTQKSYIRKKIIVVESLHSWLHSECKNISQGKPEKFTPFVFIANKIKIETKSFTNLSLNRPSLIQIRSTEIYACFFENIEHFINIFNYDKNWSVKNFNMFKQFLRIL